jgi:hypothetical protein
MVAMLGISLYSYLYLKLEKNSMSFLISLMSSLQQNWRREQNKYCLDARGWEKRERTGEQGEKWPKQCMHIWINE